MLFSIGKFSKMTGVSTKALIWYDSIGLLKPEFVDENNGYRFYGDKSLKRLIEIRYWQDIGYSVKEIMDIDNIPIDKKIKDLEEKIHLLQKNIMLLYKIKEGEVKKGLSLFEIENSQEFQSLMFGRWRYSGSSTNFKDVYEGYGKKKFGDVPQYLFFGEGDCGTDLKQKFKWGADYIEFDSCQEYIEKQKQLIYDKYKDVFDVNDLGKNWFDEQIELEDKVIEKREKAFEEISKIRKPKGSAYWYFVLNHDNTLVLYEKLEDEGVDGAIVFHIYSRWDRNVYSESDILSLISKFAPQPDDVYNQKPADKLIGYWEAYDEINGSQIEAYEGNVVSETPEYALSLLFNFLEINENGDCFIMKEGDEFNIVFLDKTSKTLTRENSKNILYANRYNEDYFILDDPQTRKQHSGCYKKIGEDEFLFVNVENEPDLDEKYYVYKKVEK